MAPTGEFTFSSGCAFATATARYDLTVGTVHANSDGDCNVNGPFAAIVAQDRYHLQGPASATPIAFTASFRMVFASSYGFLPFVFQEGTGDPGWRSTPDQVFSYEAFLPLLHFTGEEFILQWGVSAYGHDGAEVLADGTLTFTGLPLGYSIVSCQGYTSGVVGAVPGTWGRTKNLYRQ